MMFVAGARVFFFVGSCGRCRAFTFAYYARPPFHTLYQVCVVSLVGGGGDGGVVQL